MPGSTPRSGCSTLRTSCSQGISSTMRSAIYTPAATVAVFPSIVAEAGPLVLIEAMASGCAVIVSKLACFDDFVQKGQNALQVDLTQAGSAEQLAIELSRLMEDQSMRGALGAAARKEAREFFLPMIAEKMLCDFEKLCAAKSFVNQAS